MPHTEANGPDIVNNGIALSRFVKGARVVKAFNHLLPDIVASDPAVGGGLRALFYSGDDVAAKAKIGAMIARLGFFGINVGPLAVCSSLDPPLRRAARPLFGNPSISPSGAERSRGVRR